MRLVNLYCRNYAVVLVRVLPDHSSASHFRLLHYSFSNCVHRVDRPRDIDVPPPERRASFELFGPLIFYEIPPAKNLAAALQI